MKRNLTTLTSIKLLRKTNKAEKFTLINCRRILHLNRNRNANKRDVVNELHKQGRKNF